MNSYTHIPNAVFDALEHCEISETQFLILSACYHWANRTKGYRVDSYSAERVCQLFSLDATPSTMKRFQRSMRNLVDRHIVRYDYIHGQERTYHVWVPDPERFERVGTAAENALSLYQVIVAVPVVVPVAVTDDATPSDTNDYGETQPHGVAVRVAEKAVPLSTTYQKTGSDPISPEKETPLNPPTGDFPPAPLPQGGERSDAAGLLESKPPQERPTARTRKPLNADQCELLNEAVLQYVSFVNWIYGFVPDVSHTAALLRRFSVTELWYAHVAKFPWHDKSLKTTMTHFYARSAAPLLEAARINGTSQVQPRLAEMEYMVSNWDKDFPRRWKIVYDAWEKVFGAESTLTAEPELVAEAVTGAKS